MKSEYIKISTRDLLQPTHVLRNENTTTTIFIRRFRPFTRKGNCLSKMAPYQIHIIFNIVFFSNSMHIFVKYQSINQSIKS